MFACAHMSHPSIARWGLADDMKPSEYAAECSKFDPPSNDVAGSSFAVCDDDHVSGGPEPPSACSCTICNLQHSIVLTFRASRLFQRPVSKSSWWAVMISDWQKCSPTGPRKLKHNCRIWRKLSSSFVMWLDLTMCDVTITPKAYMRERYHGRLWANNY